MISKQRKRDFLARLKQNERGCWIWQGALLPTGYGMTSIDNISMYVHRASYLLFVGELKKGLIIHHKCNVSSCGNYNHLEQITYKQHAKLSRRDRDQGRFC